MTWSLGVEEQFYVIFPLLMLLFATARRKYIFLGTLLVIAVSLAACILGTPRYPTAVFYLLPTRAWELAFGVLLAIYEKGRISQSLYLQQRLRHVLSTTGILLIAIGIFFFNSHTSFPGYAALLPVCGTVCMLTAPGGWANRLLSTAPFVFIGQISYSLYLWHWPLLSFSRIISDHPISVAKGCAIAIISIVIAWLSYRFVEQPCRRSKTPTRPLLIRYALLCAILIVPAMLFRTSAGLPQRFPKLQPVIAYRDWELDKCSYVTSFDQPSFCIDVHDPRPAIALFGDSHAQTISSALRELANQSGYKMYELVKYVCVPLTGVVSTQKLTHGQECLDHNAKVISFLQHDPNVKFVVLAANWEGPDLDDASYVLSDRLNSRVTVEQSHQNLLRGLAATIATLQSAGKQVILIQDVPIFTFDPMRRILSMYIPVRGYLARHLFPPAGVQGKAPLSETFTAEGNAAAQIIDTIGATHQSSVFDPKPNLCAPDCLFFRDQYPIFFDREHVTPIGAQLALTGLTFPSNPRTIPNATPASTQPPQSSTKPPSPWSSASLAASSIATASAAPSPQTPQPLPPRIK
jgi:SGNH domain (fused to AT3 domains)/Acyltransferase family